MLAKVKGKRTMFKPITKIPGGSLAPANAMATPATAIRKYPTAALGHVSEVAAWLFWTEHTLDSFLR